MASDPPFLREATRQCVVQRRRLIEIRAQADRESGIGLKLFGFIAESVFTFVPESCSGSSRNAVRNHPGIAFTFPRNPHKTADYNSVSSANTLYAVVGQ